MRVAYLSFSVLPSKSANSVHVMKMCNAFSKIGVDITLFGRFGEDVGTNPYDFYGVSENFRLNRVNYLPIPFVNSLWTAKKYKKMIKKEEDFDVFYGRNLMSLLAVADLNRPIFYESHEPPQSSLKINLERRLFKKNNFKNLVVISLALKKKYLEIFKELEWEDIVIAHDGADLYENSRKKVEEANENSKIGYVGSLYKGRGLELILELATRFPNNEFHIIGGSKSEVYYWKNEQNNSNILFHGHISPGNVMEYHEKMDILLAPYQKKVSIGSGKKDTSKWMSPLKIFEYMAAKKPIICSDIPVLREVLNEENSILVNPEEVGEWEIAIKKIIENAEFKEKISGNAYASLVKNFTWEIRAKNLIEVFKKHYKNSNSDYS